MGEFCRRLNIRNKTVDCSAVSKSILEEIRIEVHSCFSLYERIQKVMGLLVKYSGYPNVQGLICECADIISNEIYYSEALERFYEKEKLANQLKYKWSPLEEGDSGWRWKKWDPLEEGTVKSPSFYAIWILFFFLLLLFGWNWFSDQAFYPTT